MYLESFRQREIPKNIIGFSKYFREQYMWENIRRLKLDWKGIQNRKAEILDEKKKEKNINY